jgi:hypothetical protein
MLTALLLAVAVLALQAPTPDQVGGELAGVVITGLGGLGMLLEQLVKKYVVQPFDDAPPLVKGVVTLVWGLALAWLGAKVPVVAQALPADPGALGTAINGVLLTLVMMGVHGAKKLVESLPVFNP